MKYRLAPLTGLLFTLAPCFLQAQNAIVIENALTGNPPSEWELPAPNDGDPTIQGYAAGFSVDRGETIDFKINVTDAAAYGIKIYRLGYYGGLGARLVADLGSFSGVSQPAPATNATGLKDYGTWSVSASWAVPADAVSGIYLAKLTRTGNGGASHIAFIVRDDDGNSDLLFKTADATWQAYNGYGGNSLYTGSGPGPGGNAHKVSYNRPFKTRGGGGGSGSSEDWLFNAEYPMIRFLERNGFDVSYTTDLDHDRDPAPYTTAQHRVLISVGHDEYWSANERAKWQGSRDNGVHLAFFSGNEVYWKTRWENSIDGNDDAHRTLVCYKEGTAGENQCNAKCDPEPTIWTGLWRSGCEYPAADGCDPENALTGQMSWVGTTLAMQVPDTYKNLRFWRNTSVASLGTGQTKTLSAGTLGYEWDYEQPAFEASNPRGRILLSSTTQSGKTHKMALYRHSSGALVFGAGTVQWSWGLDAVHDGSAAPVDPDIQQATINLLADMDVQPETLQGGLVAASASSDGTAPESVITTPGDGAEFPNNSMVTISGTASDAGGGVVAGVEVSVDGGTTWKVATGTEAWSFTWVPTAEGEYVIKSRAFDDSGNMESPGTAPAVNAITVDIEGALPCPCTLFLPTDVPVVAYQHDGNTPVEVGMKFRTTEDGFITALRFYKGAGNGGTHTGNLWSASGTLLGSSVFTDETASGWQEVALSPPVAVEEGTTYIVSYHSSGGGYAITNPYFSTARINGPLRGLAHGEDGPNGVYLYSPTPAFPTQNYQTSNYWADVVFEESVGLDETAPVVTARTPAPNATGVSIGANVTATFNEAIDQATMIASTFFLEDDDDNEVPASLSYHAGTRTATLDPDAALAYSSTYTARLVGGGSGITDLAGNPLAADVTWSFTTGAEPPPPPPPPDEGAGGPILLISGSGNPFSRYPVEILRAEGFNQFDAVDITSVTSTMLDEHDAVVLGETAISPAQVALLSDWVDAGGALIVLRPQAGNTALQGLLGIVPAGGSTSEGYLLVNTATAPGAGIVNETIQFHGTADHYTLTNGATSVATLYTSATNATSYPAVTHRSVGTNGGSASAFTYDLARSVVHTRQGNPAWAGQNRETTDAGIRSNDLFHGNASGDPQPDWVNLDKVAIPQADEQQHLLSNLITLGSLHRKPMPRLWFLPSKHKAAVVMTGDDHGVGLTNAFFDDFILASGGNNSPADVANWTAVRGTSYMYPNTPLPNASNYQSQGFEVGIHVNTGCTDGWTPASLASLYDADLAAFAGSFPDIDPPSTHRTHCISWRDYDTQPQVESARGIRLDVNYYYWPAAWVNDRPGMFTGSGLPMRFAQEDGTLIDCFQVATQMTDESGQSYPAHWQQLINKALGSEGYYGVFCANFHTDRQSSRALATGLISYAQSQDVPVVSAKQMLTWLDGRNASTYEDIEWSSGSLTFTASVGSGAHNLYGMLPFYSSNGPLTSISNGGSVPFSVETIKGISYAFFPVSNGNYIASYQADEAAPAITNVVATPAANGTATITWTTDEPATSRVDYAPEPDALTFNSTDGAMVTEHSMMLTGLAPNTTYWFRVTSVDGSSNTASEPAAPDSLSFIMPDGLCAQDDSKADFDLGATDASTLIVEDGGGALILKPVLEEEFNGNAVPAGWTSGNFNPGATTVNGGSVTVHGTHVYTNGSYGPGTMLDFVATYNAGSYQNVGFSADQPFNNAPWIVVGQGATADGNLYARASDNTSILLGTNLLGSAHRYRLKWNASNFEVYVDDAVTPNATINMVVGSNLYVQISDVNNNDGSLSVDRMRITPYSASGSYASRIFDKGASASWGEANWTAMTPSGTSLSITARSGNTPAPDGTWTAFAPLTNGSPIGSGGQYLQYKAELATTNTAMTPVLEDVSIQCSNDADAVPPVISNVLATPAMDGLSATIEWETDEAANSTVSYGIAADALDEQESDAAFVLAHSVLLTGLSPGTTYHFRVTSEDLAENSSSEPDAPGTLTFITPVPPAPPCFVDDDASDFAQGTLTSTHLSLVDDAVILKPTAASEFTTLPPTGEWASYPWSGGTSSVSSGLLTVDGARYNSTSTAPFGPGASLEFVATFGAGTFQHIGFGGGTDAIGTGGIYNGESAWAMFSTQNTTNTVRARSFNGSTSSNIDFTGNTGLIGTAHRYRIDWNALSIEFYVDGQLVHTENMEITGTMRPAISDFNNGGPVVQVDWIRATPYITPGDFDSRVFDGGVATDWSTLDWTATEPANTSLSLSVRTGNTSTPDGSWTAFFPVNNGEEVDATSRYIQYRAHFTTTDTRVSPALEQVSIACTEAPLAAPEVTLQPDAQQACDGEEVELAAAASGNPLPSVQWEVSTDDGDTWEPIPDADELTLGLTAAMASDGHRYRAVFDNGIGGPVESDDALLTVRELPSGAMQAFSIACLNDAVALTFEAGSGASPFTLTVSDTEYLEVLSGIPFAAGMNATHEEHSIWAPATVGGSQAVDNAATELGIRFSSTEAGTVSAIRFYKTGSNVATFTASLWSNTGTLLATTAPYLSDNTPGWKELELLTPVSIEANVPYRASYFSPSSNYYAFTANGMSSPVVNAPLTAEASFYRQPGPGFPTSNSVANYWVDVVFTGTTTLSFTLQSITDANGCAVSGASLSTETVTVTDTRTYYSKEVGDASGPLWSTTPAGMADYAVWNPCASMVVQSTHAVTVSADIEVKSLEVEPGGTLLLTDGTKLTAWGTSAILAGALSTASNSTIELRSNLDPVTLATLGTPSLYNLNVRASGGTTLLGNLHIRGTLQLDAGDFDAASASVTLRSTATHTGRLGPLGPEASYTGNLKVERYIPGGATNWRLLGSPIAGRTVAAWQDDFFTAGYPGSQYPNFYSPPGSGILWPSIRWYDEAHTGAGPNDGMTGVSSSAQPLSQGQGFAVWCGDNLGGTAPFTVDVENGAPHIASTPIVLPMSWTDTGNPSVDGWNLVSNPVPSAIAFNQISRGADVEDYVTFYNPANGNMAVYDISLDQGTNSATNTIQSSQGFFLKASGPAVTTTVKETDKVDDNTGGVFGGLMPDATPLVRLQMSSGINTFSDETIIVFTSGTPERESQDALKHGFAHNAAPQIATIAPGGTLLAINAYGPASALMSIPVSVNAGVTGTYTVTITVQGDLGLDCLVLEDLSTGAIIPVTNGATHHFGMNANDDQSIPRFRLRRMGPEAGFTAASSAAVDEPLVFTNTSLNALTYTWDFGDGSVSTEANPTHAWSAEGTYEVVLEAYTGTCTSSFTRTVVVGSAPISLRIRIFLEGPYDSATGLMSDALRMAGLLPSVEPYTAIGHGQVTNSWEMLAPGLLAIDGADALVDWVLVELRDGTDPTSALAARAVLVQRDGDVVRADGNAVLSFNYPAGLYHIVVRHRNHLAIMTRNALSLGGTSTTIDFTSDAVPTFGTDGSKAMDGAHPAQVLWAGDVNSNGTLKYTGEGNDRDFILQAVGGSVPTNTITGYHGADVNMDGTVKYTGQGNDRDPILLNIGGSVPTNVRAAQVP